MMKAAALVFVLLSLASCAPVRHFEAVQILRDLAAGGDAALSGRRAVLRQSVDYTVAGRARHADLYLPGTLAGCVKTRSEVAGCPRAGIVAVPGAAPLGKDDPRFTAFAATLARAGFAVLAPDLAGLRQLRVRPSDAREIADAFAYLASRPELAPGGRSGMFAFSYAVGPTVLAALEDDIRERVRYIVGVGGYHDLPRAMRFFTTGWFEHAGQWHHLSPDETGKMVLLYASLDYLAGSSDRMIFERMVALRMRDPNADPGPLAAGLSSDAQAVYALAANHDPARFSVLFDRLPEAMRADIGRLDLARRDLKQLKARLILLHGKSDTLIPYPESLALAAAAPPGQASVLLIRRVLGHVDLNRFDLLAWRFWSEDLPDLWRLWRVIDLLLAQREAAA